MKSGRKAHTSVQIRDRLGSDGIARILQTLSSSGNALEALFVFIPRTDKEQA